MSEPEQNSVLAELKAMRKQLVTIGNLVHGIYRRAKGMPTQPPIPGLGDDDSPMPQPGEIAKNIPRRWCNTVRVHEALWEVFGDRPFRTDDLRGDALRTALDARTDRSLTFRTVERMMTTVHRAGAARRDGRGPWTLAEPTDALREAVEAAAAKLSEQQRECKRAARGEPSNLRTCDPANGGREAPRA